MLCYKIKEPHPLPLLIQLNLILYLRRSQLYLVNLHSQRQHNRPPPQKFAKKTGSDGNFLSKFMHTTSREEKKALDKQVGRYIYATNVSFRSVEH